MSSVILSHMKAVIHQSYPMCMKKVCLESNFISNSINSQVAPFIILHKSILRPNSPLKCVLPNIFIRPSSISSEKMLRTFYRWRNYLSKLAQGERLKTWQIKTCNQEAKFSSFKQIIYFLQEPCTHRSLRFSKTLLSSKKPSNLARYLSCLFHIQKAYLCTHF